MFWANTIGVYGFTATVPAVINGLGYTSAQAQLLTIPVYVFAMILTLVFAWASDKMQQRSPFIMLGYSIASVGFIAELAIPHPKLPGLTYAFLFVVAAGLYAPFICIVCIIGNNLAPSSKRAVGMARKSISLLRRLLNYRPLANRCDLIFLSCSIAVPRPIRPLVRLSAND
jgi:hypothetical protein